MFMQMFIPFPDNDGIIPGAVGGALGGAVGVAVVIIFVIALAIVCWRKGKFVGPLIQVTIFAFMRYGLKHYHPGNILCQP